MNILFELANHFNQSDFDENLAYTNRLICIRETISTKPKATKTYNLRGAIYSRKGLSIDGSVKNVRLVLVIKAWFTNF